MREYILANNGATVNYKGEVVIMKSGYQVSKRDLGRVRVADFTEEMIDTIVSYGLKRGEYASFWVEDGFVYCDISVRVNTLREAMSRGAQLNQISVYRWRDCACVYVA